MASPILPTSLLAWCPPEPGKPGPNGTRIAQKRQPGPTCAFYAAHLVRGDDRLKYSTDPTRAHHRKLEKDASALRKAITQNHEVFNDNSSIATLTLTIFKRKTMTKKMARDILRVWRWATIGGEKETKEKIRVLLQKFCQEAPASEDSLMTFVDNSHSRSMLKSMDAFCKSINVSESAFQIRVETALPGSSRLELSNQALNQQQIIHDLINRGIYGLQFSSWTPFDSVESLIKELNLHKRLLVGVCLEKGHHSNPLHVLPRVNGRRIYSRNSKNLNLDLSSRWRHMLALIGASYDGKVYYLDPIDSSLPNDPDSQKILFMSYKKLQTITCDVLARSARDEQGRPRPSYYAYYFKGVAPPEESKSAEGPPPAHPLNDGGGEPTKEVYSVDAFFDSDQEEESPADVYDIVDVDVFLASLPRYKSPYEFTYV